MNKNALLWEITKAKSDKSSYIFGTIHLGGDQFADRISGVTTVLEKVDVFAAEHDLCQSKLALPTHMPHEYRLSQIFSEKEYKKASKAIKKAFAINLWQLDGLYPIQIYNLISMAALDISAHQPMDLTLWEFAKSIDKTLIGLESIEDTKRIFNSIPIAYQKAAIKSCYRNVTKFRKKIILTVDYYQDQDIRLLYQSAKSGLSDLKKMMLYDRNQAMTTKIAQTIEGDESVFCAVGAAHLYGKYGMIRALKTAGYKLKPVTLP